MAFLESKLMERPYLPIFITIIFALFVSLLGVASENIPQAQVFTPEGEGTKEQAQAGFLNALLLVVPGVVGSFIILYLVRKGSFNFLLSMYRFLFFILGGMVFYLVGDGPLYILSERIPTFLPSYLLTEPVIVYPVNWDAPLGAGIVFSAIITGVLFNPHAGRLQKNLSLLLFSGMLGGFLAIVLYTWTVLIVLLLLSLYDLYAVFYGPIKEIVNMFIEMRSGNEKENKSVPTPREIFSSLTYQGEGWELGMGDLVFYSLLTAHSTYYGLTHPLLGGITWALFLLPVSLALFVGFYLTELLLERYHLLPGLPIPMGLGVGTFIALMLLL